MSRERKNNRSKLGQAIRNGEPLSGGVAGGGDRVHTREPEVTVRDPVTIPRMPKILLMEIEVPKCTKCGSGTFRNGGGLRPNMMTGKMNRYKDCARCGQRFLFVNEPTIDELKRYWS